MNKKLVLILTALGCGTLLFLTVLVGGAGFFIYQSMQNTSIFGDDYLAGLDDYDFEAYDAAAKLYTEVGANYLADRLKADHPDHKVLLFCATEPAVERDDITLDVDLRLAIERGLAKTYGEGTVTTVYVDVEPLSDADYEDDQGYYFDYKVAPASYTAAMAQADANTICIWTLPLPKNFRTLPQAVRPPATSPVLVLFEVDTTGLNDLIASGHITAAVDFAINDAFDFTDDVPEDRDVAFKSLYYYIDAATIPGILKDHPDYFDGF